MLTFCNWLMKHFGEFFCNWVRKLNWETRGYYTPGLRVQCSPHPLGFEDETRAYSLAAESKAVRIHSDLLRGDLAIAACIVRFSSGETRACKSIPRLCLAAIFGLPILEFIKLYVLQKYLLTETYFVYYSKSTIKNVMANNLSTEKKALIIAQLAEGASIRSIERITGVHRDTIMRLGVRVGEACARIHDEKMRDLPCLNIEVDEIWGYVGKKRCNLREFEQVNHGYGDAWTYVALDADSKLIPAYRVSSVRSVQATHDFIRDLSLRLRNRVQLSTDGLTSYEGAILRNFGGNVDYAQVVKTYSVCNLNKDAASRYSPADVVKTELKVICGEPDRAMISTSHVEKQNHTLRMHCRRLTRLTNAFSKKFENFEAAVALNFVYYNFCKRHIAIKTTPAVAAGIENHEWTVKELIERCGE
jgi:hypothetical protein